MVTAVASEVEEAAAVSGVETVEAMVVEVVDTKWVEGNVNPSTLQS